MPKHAPGGLFGGGPPPEPKGDLHPLLDMLGIDWPTTEIVWNAYNPHPQLADLPPEVVFISRRGGAADAFNAEADRDLGPARGRDAFPRPAAGPGRRGPEFTPLLRTDDAGGTLAWSEATQQSFMGIARHQPQPPSLPQRHRLHPGRAHPGQPRPTDQAKKDAETRRKTRRRTTRPRSPTST